MKRVLEIFALMFLTSAGRIILNAQWIQQNSGTSAALTDVITLDSTTAIAVGRDGSILRTTNDGTTWNKATLLFSSIKPWNGISFFDTTDGIVVGDHGTVVMTTDGGRDWFARAHPGGQILLSALHVGPGNIYAGADSGWIYHSLDSGITWSSEKISTGAICCLFAWRGTYAMGLPVYVLTPFSLYFKMEFPSSPWSETKFPFFSGLGSAAQSGEFCNGGGAGFIVGVQGDFWSEPIIIRKPMGDIAWHNVLTGISEGGILFGVSAPSANVIYVCGSGGMIFRSSDGGDKWTAASVPTTRYLRAIYFYDEKRGFAVGDSGTILYTSNGGMTGIDGGPLPMRFVLYQNYPNPFNPTTKIQYSVASKQYIILKVYDILGRELATLVNETKLPGSYEVEWDANGFACGVYFYQLRAGDPSISSEQRSFETKKLILIR